jgi:hypothetical protein
MIVELSTDNVIEIVIAGCVTVATIGGWFIALWMREVSAHNKISEARSDALKKELDELRDTMRDTRETYVTSARFEKVTDNIMGKLDEIMKLLSAKPDRDFCDMKHNKLVEITKK